jgi:uncharacterized protein (DUF885 family)
MPRSSAARRRSSVAIAAALALAYGAAMAADARPSADERFLAHLQGAYERQLQANPSMATEEGGAEGNDRWESLGEAGANAGAAAAQRELDVVRREFADAPLGPRARMQYRVFERSQELLLDRYRWRNHLYPLNQITGPPIDIPQVLGAQKVASAADAEAWLRRVSATREYLGGLVERLELQAQRGVYLPRSVYPIVAAQARGLRDGVPAGDGPEAQWSTPILEDFTAKLGSLPLPAADREALRARARAALVNDLRPAYGRVIETLEAHAARTPVDGGVWQLPEGDAFYAFLVRQYTTTDMTPADVHELGLSEVARTHREMAAIMAQVGYEGDLKGFMQQMKSDRRFYLTDDEAGRSAYLARAREIVAAMQAKLPAAFLQPPPLPLEIRPTPDYRAAGAPSGFYTGGTAGRQPSGNRVAEPHPARHTSALRTRDAALSRGRAGPSPADLEHSRRSRHPRTAQGEPLLGELGLRRRLGALRGAPRQGNGLLPGSVRGFRSARGRAVARHAARGG